MGNGMDGASMLQSPLGPSAPQDTAAKLNFDYQVALFELLGYQKEHANEIALKQKILALYKHCEEENDPNGEEPSSHAIWSQLQINDSWGSAGGPGNSFGEKLGLDDLCHMSTYQYRVMKTFDKKDLQTFNQVLDNNFVSNNKTIDPSEGKYPQMGYDKNDDDRVWFSNDYLKKTFGGAEDQMYDVDRGSIGNLLALTLRQNDIKEEKVSALRAIHDFIGAPSNHEDVPDDFNFDFTKENDYSYNDKLAVLWQTLITVNESKRGRQFLADQFEYVMRGKTPVFDPFNAIDPPIDEGSNGSVLSQSDDKVILFCLPRMVHILQAGLAEAIRRWEKRHEESGDQQYKDWIDEAWRRFALRRWRIFLGTSDIYHGKQGNEQSISHPMSYGSRQERHNGNAFSNVSAEDIQETTKKLGRRRTGNDNSAIESEYGVAIGMYDSMIELGVKAYTIPDGVKGKSFVSLAGYVWGLAMVADSTAYNLVHPDKNNKITSKEAHAGLSAIQGIAQNKEVVVFNRLIKDLDTEAGMFGSAWEASKRYSQLEAAEEVSVAKKFLSEGERVFYGLMGTIGIGLDAMTCYWEVNDGLDEYGNEDTSAAIGHFLNVAATGTGAALAAYSMVSGAAAAWGSGAMQVVMGALTASGPGGWIVAAALLIASAIAFILLTWTNETLLEEYVMNSKFGTAWNPNDNTKTDPGNIDFRFTHTRGYDPSEAELVERDEVNIPRQLSETPGLNFELTNMEKEYSRGTQYWHIDLKFNNDLLSSEEVIFLQTLTPNDQGEYLPPPIHDASYLLPYGRRHHYQDKWAWITTPVKDFWDGIDVPSTPYTVVGDSSIGLCPKSEISYDEITYRLYHPTAPSNARYKLFGLSDQYVYSSYIYLEAIVVSKDLFSSMAELVGKLEEEYQKHFGSAGTGVDIGDLVFENFQNVKRARAPIKTQEEDDSWWPFYG